MKILKYLLTIMIPIIFIILASLTLQEEQRMFGWFLFFTFVVIFILRGYNSKLLRVSACIIAAFIATRYILFRIFYTLDIQGIEFWVGLVLFSAEMYCFIIFILNLIVNINPISRKKVVLQDNLLSVDILIPTYNEDIEVVYMTALACKALDYPKHLVNIYILNDGSRIPRLNNPELTESLLLRHKELYKMASELGINYLTRESNDKAKAGMLNAALKGEAFQDITLQEDGIYIPGKKISTSGDLILILDCDHIPAKDLLKNTVCYFKDSKMALVQTPHFMINSDPLRKNTKTTAIVPCESSLFYNGIQKGLDSWSGSYFCGSAAIIRRSILEEVGWISGDTITEDAECSLEIHSRGYKSVYMEKPMIAGIAPESFDIMIKQRIRWCQGMLQILILKNPIFRRGLSMPIRICYLNNSLHWLFPFSRIIFLLAPLMYIFFNINIYNASLQQVYYYSIPYLFVSILLFIYMFGKKRTFLQSEILEMLQTFSLIPAIIRVIISPKKPSFSVTPKGIKTDDTTLSQHTTIFLVFFIILIVAYFKILYIWNINSLATDAIKMNFIWNTYNLIILLCCLGVMKEGMQRRHYYRCICNQFVTVNNVKSELVNLSVSGFAIKADPALFHNGQEVEYNDDNVKFKAKICRKEADVVAGYFTDFNFQEMVPYVYGSSDRWQAMQESYTGGNYIFDSFKAIFKMMLSSVKCLSFLLRRKLLILFTSVIIPLLCITNVKAATDIVYFQSLVHGDDYVFTGYYGEFIVPFYLPQRADIDNIVLNIFYERTDAKASIFNAEVTLDAKYIKAEKDNITDKNSFSFILPKEKLIPGYRTAIIKLYQDDNVTTRIDLKKSNLTVTSSSSLLGDNVKNLGYIFDPEVPVPKKLCVVLEDNDAIHIKRAMLAVQNLSIRLRKRPLDIYVYSQQVHDMDCVLIGDSYMQAQDSLSGNEVFATLTEKDFDIPLKPPASTSAGKTFTFDDLGLETVTFRQFSSAEYANFIVPIEANLTPNKRLKILLNLVYSEGMPDKASIDVMVNQRMFANIILDDKKGKYLQNYEVNIPVSLLNKGVNRFWLRPNLSDDQSKDRNNRLFVSVFHTSSIFLPHTGIHVRIPELKSVFTSGYPFPGNSQSVIRDNSNKSIEAFLNFAAIISQKRGSIGRNVDLQIDREFKSVDGLTRYPTIFNVDPETPEGVLIIESKIINYSTRTINLMFKAKTPQTFSDGMKLLWNDDIQQQLSGTLNIININTKEVTKYTGDTIVISDEHPLQLISFYANNYRIYFMAVLFFFLIFLVVLIWYVLIKKDYEL